MEIPHIGKFDINIYLPIIIMIIISQFLETRWDYMLRRDDYSINLHPNPKIISKVSI